MTIEVPEGFVEFSLQVMQRAAELRKAGASVPSAIAYTDAGKAIWDNKMQHCVETAARALLMAVEPVTIEAEAVDSPVTWSQ